VSGVVPTPKKSSLKKKGVVKSPSRIGKFQTHSLMEARRKKKFREGILLMPTAPGEKGHLNRGSCRIGGPR